MLTLSSIEDLCEAQGVTLVMHPAIRRALDGYEESFYVGATCFLRGESDGVYFLPLDQGFVRLRFNKRWSPNGHAILRLEPVLRSGLDRVKAAAGENRL